MHMFTADPLLIIKREEKDATVRRLHRFHEPGLVEMVTLVPASYGALFVIEDSAKKRRKAFCYSACGDRHILTASMGYPFEGDVDVVARRDAYVPPALLHHVPHGVVKEHLRRISGYAPRALHLGEAERFYRELTDGVPTATAPRSIVLPYTRDKASPLREAPENGRL